MTLPKITFADYMEEALYGPDGYYASGAVQSGRHGDYFTAPDVGFAFARLLSAILVRWSEQFAVRPFHFVEVAAGEGALASAIGRSLQKDAAGAVENLIYTAVERSPARRQSLLKLSETMPCDFRVVPELAAIGDRAWTGCMFANEWIDALPVHRVRRHGGRLEEAYVDVRDGVRQWTWAEPSTPALQAYFDRLKLTLPDDYETEINLAMRAQMADAARCLAAGFIVLIDYGRPAHDYYHPERNGGTLRGFRKHEVRRHVLSDQIMDITADVDFTSLALDGQAAGLTPLAFMDMGSFLMSGARLLLEKDHDKPDIRPITELREEWGGLRYLVHPEGMGSAFHVLILGKGLDPQDWRFEGNRLRRLGLE